MAQRNRLVTRPCSPNFGFKNLSWMAKGVNVFLLHLPTLVNSFVLPNQNMQLEVYDSAPLVQFPARHSGSLQLEDWVDPAPVNNKITKTSKDIDTVEQYINKDVLGRMSLQTG